MSTPPRGTLTSHPFRLLTASLLLLSAALPLHAGLTWENKEITATADPDETELKTAFHFKNESDKPITITNVHPSCGCTTAALEKKTYAPGEGGEIPITYTYTTSALAERVSTVHVQTDEPDSKPDELKLTVHVPEMSVNLSPRLLAWRIGQKPQPKVVRIKLLKERGFELTDVKVDGEGFEAATRPPAEGAPHQHVVVVTPAQTKSSAHATLLLTFKRPDKEPKTYRVRLVVKKSA